MEDFLITFYYQFHKQQHYFLCHDILEEAWKGQPTFSKRDAIVSLILFTTANYHYRRGNTKGALKSLKKALEIIHHAKESQRLHLNIDVYRQLIKSEIAAIKENRTFIPVKLPVDKTFNDQIKHVYSDYRFTPFIVSEPYIVHHHLKRDRTSVIHERERAKSLRRNQLKASNNTLKDQ